VYSFTGDPDSGLYNSGANQVSVAIGGLEWFRIGSTSILSGSPFHQNNGTAGTPTYSFNGDENTGMYSPTTDSIAFSTGGSEQVRLDSSGRLGVNQTSPSAMVDIVGDSGQKGLEITTTAAQWMDLGADVAASNYFQMRQPASASALAYIGGGAGGAISAGASTDLAIRSEGNLYFASGGNNPRLILATGGSQLAWQTNFTSTADATTTMDASIYQFGRWIASFTAARTLQISNLTDGRWIMCYIRNTNGTARTITFNASTTAAGYAAVNMSREGAVSVTSISHAATSGTSTVFIMNIGGTFIGSIS
jgi:hypothetical protein